MSIRALLHRLDDTPIQFDEARQPECGRVNIHVYVGEGDLDELRWAAHSCPEAYESSTGKCHRRGEQDHPFALSSRHTA